MQLSPVRYRVDEAVRLIREREARTVDIALILGSGLSPYASTLVNASTFPYAEIPHMPSVSIPGHSGTLVVGELPNMPPGQRSPVIAALAGRVHMYEGYSAEEVVFPLRLLLTLGAKYLVVTNAAGGISATLEPGDLVLISDHLNLQGRNPLVGMNDDALGPRFPDMTEVYDRGTRAVARKVAEEMGMSVREGVYAALLGPSYETPAEIRMLRAMGADLVGMSTVPEAIVARHMGARVLGISCVTNLAAGVSPVPLSHTEVEATARATREKFTRFVEGTLRALPLEPKAK
ncbi:MAG: purine-nucleoside phosphorylase [Deltaproteobacteria bacterium]